MPPRQSSFAAELLRRRYRLLAAALALAVLAAVALLMLPLRERDGRFDKNPYGLLTSLENAALDLLFQLRDARHPQIRQRAAAEPITIIEVDERAIKASDRKSVV
jgi:hypothetical protein